MSITTKIMVNSCLFMEINRECTLNGVNAMIKEEEG